MEDNNDKIGFVDLIRKNKTYIILAVCVVAIIGICVAFFAVKGKGNNYDTVENKTANTTTITTVSGKTTTKLSSAENITIIVLDGTEIPTDFDVTLYAKRAYELKCIFAFNEFKDISKVSESKIVQFAFCHIYFDSLVDMPENSKMVYRSASVSQIKTQLKTLFNNSDVDVKSSDLYNASKNEFEMWQPNYNTEVYINCSVSSSGEDYVLQNTIYTDNSKSAVKAQTTVTVSKDNNGYYIKEYK